MDAPTVAAIRTWTPTTVVYGDIGYDVADPDPLAEIAAQAGALFVAYTGLSYSDVPAELEPLVRRGVAGLTYMLAVQSQPDYLDTLADFDLISSFSAGSYSETRRSPEDAMKARMLVAWPWLNDLLWLLMTDDKRDYWDSRFGGTPVPAWEVTEVDWTTSPYLDTAGGWW